MSYHSELDIQIRESQKYNGWTNYATWRINLEIFDGMDFTGYSRDTFTLSEQLKDFVEDCVFDAYDEGLVKDYANAFINDVNWYEIAEHIIDDEEGEAQLQEDYDENTN